MQLGFTREEVSLALAAAGDTESLNNDKVRTLLQTSVALCAGQWPFFSHTRGLAGRKEVGAADLAKRCIFQVMEFCKNYKELKSMGFDTATVTGALVLHMSDLSAATDACLSS